MSEETRRSFIKSSVSKTLLATNATVLAGLINTPGVVRATGEGSTTETTEVTTTVSKVIIWKIITTNNASNTISPSVYPDSPTALNKGILAASLLSIGYPADATVDPNIFRDYQGTRQPCCEIDPAPATPLVQTYASGTGFKYKINIPAGSTKIVYFK